MKTFRVFYSIHGKVQFGNFNIVISRGTDNVNISFKDIINEKFDQLSTVKGSLCYLDLTAPNINDALKQAEDSLSKILIRITLATKSVVSIDKVLFIIDASPEINIREFYQFTGINLDFKNVRPVGAAPFVDILKSMPRKMSSDVERATRWYWKGLEDSDLVDSFINYFIGLEALNEHLQKARKTYPKCPSCGYIAKECPKCHKSIPVSNIKLLGIKHFMTEVMRLSENAFEEIKSLRDDLLHVNADYDSLRPRLKSAIAITEKTLLFALYHLMNLPHVEKMSVLPIWRGKEGQLLITGFVEGKEVSKIEPPVARLFLDTKTNKVVEKKSDSHAHIYTRFIVEAGAYSLKEVKLRYLGEDSLVLLMDNKGRPAFK